MTEEEILQHALDLAQQEKTEDERGRSIEEEETIFLRTLARRVPMSKALDIVREVGRYTGGIGIMRLTPEQRTAKAKMAAAARWKKEKRKKKN
jgi:hypothetical protein